MANQGGNDDFCLGRRDGAGVGRSVLRRAAVRKASGTDMARTSSIA